MVIANLSEKCRKSHFGGHRRILSESLAEGWRKWREMNEKLNFLI